MTITGTPITGDVLYVKATCPHCKDQIVKVKLVPDPITLTGSIVNGTCENCGDPGEPECNGSIKLYVCGGVRPFSYDWSGVTKSGKLLLAHTKDLGNLEESTGYTVTVTDSYGLTATQTFVLDVAPCNPPTGLNAIAPNLPTPIPTSTPTPTNTNAPSPATYTPTPTPTSTTFTGIIGWDSVLVSEACSKVNTANVTGDQSTFCFSSTFTSLDFYSLGTGNYYLSDGVGYMTAPHTYGQNTMVKTSGGGCTNCGGSSPTVNSINMVTGTSINQACTGKTSHTYYYTGTFTNGTVLYTDSGLTTVAPPGFSGGSRYYNAVTWNTIYYIQDNLGHAYDSGENCPPPTANPWTQDGVYVSTYSALDACCIHNDYQYTLTISGYGGNDFTQCSSLHDLPQVIRDLTTTYGTEFWLSKDGLVKKFIYTLNGNAEPTIDPVADCPSC